MLLELLTTMAPRDAFAKAIAASIFFGICALVKWGWDCWIDGGDSPSEPQPSLPKAPAKKSVGRKLADTVSLVLWVFFVTIGLVFACVYFLGINRR